MKSLFIDSGSANIGPWAVLIIFGALLLVMRMVSAPGSAQSQPPQNGAELQNQRLFENPIPKDVPIKVKIKKEKEESAKSMTNEKWVREFELEVTNTGDKPIYFLFLHLITDVKFGGLPLMFSLVYGRVELGDIISKALPDDIPIKPGETHAFKIHAGQVSAWEKSVREERHAQASRIKIKLESLSFGDGTGYFGTQSYPPPRKQDSDRRSCAEQLKRAGPNPRHGRMV